MTETLQRPSSSSMPPRRRPGTPRPPRPAVVGVVAALRVAALGLLAVALPVLLVWAADPRAGSAVRETLQTAGQLWLVAHGASLAVGDADVTLAPLALCALPLLLLWRAGASVSRECRATSARDAARCAAAVAVPYAVATGAVAVLSTTAEVRPGLVSAPLSGLALGLLGAGAGALATHRLWRAAWLALPASLRRVLPGVAVATALLAAGGALLAGTSLAVHGARAADLAGATAPGPVGGVALLLLGLSLVPNAVVWGTSWLAGPGFAVGVGTAVGPFGHELGPVPALPLLAALPGSGLPGWLGALGLVVPLAAGALAGRVLHRGDADGSTGRALADAAGVGVVCGLGWALLAWLSGGAAGAVRLVEVGPSPWELAAAVAAEVTAGAVAAVLLLRRRAQTAAGLAPAETPAPA